MNRWVLLEHIKNDEIHFDFLVEDNLYCITWKILEIQFQNGPSIAIINQPNHRLFWLNQKEKQLSRNRGFVKRKDLGNFQIINNNLTHDSFSLNLNGNILCGIFQMQDGFCQLISTN